MATEYVTVEVYYRSSRQAGPFTTSMDTADIEAVQELALRAAKATPKYGKREPLDYTVKIRGVNSGFQLDYTPRPE